MKLLSQIDDIASYTKQAEADLVKAENEALPDYLAEAESMGELYLEVSFIFYFVFILLIFFQYIS